MRTSNSFLLIIALLLPLASAPALASHYALEDASFLKPDEVKAFKAAGIGTTEGLLSGLATPDKRKALAGKTALKPARLRELAEFCDLLRIRGIGPKMATLLRLSGVMHSKDLAAQKGSKLAIAMKAANDLHQVSETLPGPQLLDGWIKQAKKLTPILR